MSEWLDLMLGEIARKDDETSEDLAEAERRQRRADEAEDPTENQSQDASSGSR